MKKFTLVLSALLILVLPLFVSAAQIKTGADNVVIPKDEKIEDDLYIASGNVNVDGEVNGDLVAVGGQVNVSGEVNGDILVAGGGVVISGNVSDDIRVAGGDVTITGNVEDDVIVFGGMVDIMDSAVISGDVKVAAGSIIIAGEVGSVEAGVDSLTLKSTAKVLGSVTYNSRNEAVIETGADVQDGITFNQTDWGSDKNAIGWFAFPKIYSVITTLLIALLFVWFLPNKTNALSKDWKDKLWKNIVWGLLFIVGAPVAIILSFVTVVGAPLGLMALPLYFVALYLAKIVAVIVFGVFVQSFIVKSGASDKIWIGVILGTLLYYFLKTIPVLGWVVTAIIYIAAMGAMIKFDWNLIKNLKKNKTF